MRLESIRNTQLYRTLPHEVGHFVQYDREVRGRAGGDPSRLLRLQDAYFAKPVIERETFAQRYAREFVEKQRGERRLPFDRLVDRLRMKQQGLESIWFGGT
jgi:hypothetical protein